MLTKYKIVDAEQAKQVHLAVGGRTVFLTADSLTNQEAAIIKTNYPDTHGKFIEEIPATTASAKAKADKHTAE
ncbi:hypothetical protein [Siphonobacter aquaeclarae]|uniref:Uncharacterized protein n=1 Tax=Siphonobacter aquaeclarae TaxID=563176 RepID=A0A1G9T1W4_9BACT|nr:hypothetical protein [Siphonobacter aquaeclarae]SDM41650.1 hypothetical protein SAMN04488090_3380 [Siphonobacter aquaeclarae]